MDRRIADLIFRAIDQTISAEGFERLQQAIEESDEVRTAYLRAVNLTESLGEIACEELTEPTARAAGSSETANRTKEPAANAVGSLAFLAIAATALIVVGGIAFWFGQRNVLPRGNEVVIGEQQTEDTAEALVAGHATLRRGVDIQWAEGGASYREGDLLPDGLLAFDAGVAEIDFFCGATLIVEGPAALDVESDWSVRVVNGRLRASVPPAARGFIVKAADSEIMDLGTEFAVEVGADSARVEVLDGEVKLLGGEHDGNHLVTGQKRWLKGADGAPTTIEGISTVSEVESRQKEAEAQRFAEWSEYSEQLQADKRLIAYYPIARAQTERIVGNATSAGSAFDGLQVGPVNRTHGRFGMGSAGLEFDRPGARVRTRIDGEFQAFTFAGWVRIDSLEHKYNALFMVDGYENGEPHWQIQDDGRLMFSVMVDDTPGSGRGPAPDARLHHIYYTEPFWDISKSGQWFHLAAVYDPKNRRVAQFINGEQVSDEPIIDDFYVDTLRIGPAEIGNWGQPLRPSPWFSVRNLNGTIDELAIFNAALSLEEIHDLYEQGKPLGY
ncbi:MAG: FecR domain-containing protein [Planctomycetaceae bacterium]|nr:FecR domain-containing protein [Planctomycetales bacterium]MCB9939636.1 FecR domain-containing protein [Planctomycetaceae bacterium]